MIKLESLRVFVTVADVGNIKEAAEKLNRTASAISMTLKQLEDEIGGPLFETDRKSSLTALGRFMQETGRVQISGYDKAIGSIRAFAENKIGHLALACVPSVAVNVIPSLLPEFVGERPEVELELFDLDSRNVGRMVETGRADIGIAGRPNSDALISFEPVFRDSFKLVCRKDSSLAAKGVISGWSDLKGHELILNGSSETISAEGYRDLSDQATITVRNVMSLLASVDAGLGISLLPALATTNLPDGLAVLDINEDGLERVVGIIERRGITRSPVAVAFRSFIKRKMPPLLERSGIAASRSG